MIILLLLLLFTLPGLAAPPLSLTIGLTERPVFQMRDDQGNFNGLDVELSRMIFDEAGIEIEYIMYPWPRIVHLLKTGKVDVALSAADTQARRTFAYFSSQALRMGHNVLFTTLEGKRRLAGIASLSALREKGFKLGVLRGVSYSYEFDGLAKQSWFTDSLVTVDSPRRLLELLLVGRVDGYLGSEYENYSLVAEIGATNVVPAMFLMSDEEAKTHIMFSKHSVSPQVVERVDQAMIRLRDSGRYEQVLQKYSYPVK